MLTIDKEFQSLCPAPSAEEYAQLEANILEDGCREPIVTWANHKETVIDGHTRYTICTKHGISYPQKALTFPDRQSVIEWIVKNQLGRRNISTSQRAVLSAHIANRPNGVNTDNTPSNSMGSANLRTLTTAEAAKKFNVSERSVQSAKKVLDSGDRKLIDAVQSGTMTVSAAVKEIKKKQDKTDPFASVGKKPKNGDTVRNTKLWGEIEGLLGKAVNRTDELNRSYPDKELHQDLVEEIKSSMKILASWKARSK